MQQYALYDRKTSLTFGETAVRRSFCLPDQLRMSAIGTKRTYRVAPHMSAFGGKADMAFCAAHVCF